MIGILSERMDWGRVEEIRRPCKVGMPRPGRLSRMLPSDTFYLEEQFRKRYPDQAAAVGTGQPGAGGACAERCLRERTRNDCRRTSAFPTRLWRNPTPARCLPAEPFPVSGGYASRLFGESWESSNLYWARLADEKGYPPATLNILVPELTRQMVANISATSIDDWPALLRAMDQTGQEFLQGRIAVDSSSHRRQQRVSQWGVRIAMTKTHKIFTCYWTWLERVAPRLPANRSSRRRTTQRICA